MIVRHRAIVRQSSKRIFKSYNAVNLEQRQGSKTLHTLTNTLRFEKLIAPERQIGIYKRYTRSLMFTRQYVALAKGIRTCYC